METCFISFRNLKILHSIVEVTNDTEIGLRIRKVSEPNSKPHKSVQSLPIQIQLATIASLEEWYNFIIDKMPLETNRMLKLKNVTEIIHFFNNDLTEKCAKIQKHYLENLGMDYSKLAYEIYERQLTVGKKMIIDSIFEFVIDFVFSFFIFQQQKN